MMTITEGLAEIHLIDKKIGKKQAFVLQHILRQESMRDPLEGDGGARTVLKSERQAINDLAERKVQIRRAIQRANEATEVVISGKTRTIADWLVWRREVAPGSEQRVTGLRNSIDHNRRELAKQGLAVGEDAKKSDIVVNVSEAELLREAEELEEQLGKLDGILSLKNATVTIDV